MDFDNLPADWWVGSLYDREAHPDWPNLAQHLYTRWHIDGAPDVLVVDTIGRWAACEDWNSYSRVVEATAPLHEISNAFPRMAVMAIHHNKKAGGDIIAAASGSNALTGAVYHIVRMTKPTTKEGDENTRKLDFVHLGGVGEDVGELSVNCGWGFSAVGFQPRQCNISVGQPQHEVRRFRYVSNFCTKSSLTYTTKWTCAFSASDQVS